MSLQSRAARPLSGPLSPMSDNIMNAPHGMNLVVECNDGSAVIGRFDESNGFEVVMHDVDLWESDQGSAEERENWVRSTATYGVAEEDLGQFYANRTILKREVVPENVADAVFVLTGPELSRTTGLHIPVDSGVAAAFLR